LKKDSKTKGINGNLELLYTSQFIKNLIYRTGQFQYNIKKSYLKEQIENKVIENLNKITEDQQSSETIRELSTKYNNFITTLKPMVYFLLGSLSFLPIDPTSNILQFFYPLINTIIIRNTFKVFIPPKESLTGETVYYELMKNFNKYLFNLYHLDYNIVDNIKFPTKLVLTNYYPDYSSNNNLYPTKEKFVEKPLNFVFDILNIISNTTKENSQNSQRTFYLPIEDIYRETIIKLQEII